MSDEPEKLAEGTLISHLLELRDRLIKALMGVGLAFVPCMMYSNDLFSYVSQPLQEKLPKGGTLIATSVMSPFTTPFKLSFFVAAFVTVPWILYQLWAFVAPGLYRHEKRFAVPLLISAIILFYTGVVFCYFFVFPVMFTFFANTTPKGVSMMTDINSFLDFVLVMFFAFGAAFEVPIAVVLLVLTDMVKLEKLRQNRGYVLLGIFVFAAFLTPPDAVSQSILAVPMYLLYEGGLVMARILLRVKRAEAEKKQLQA